MIEFGLLIRSASDPIVNITCPLLAALEKMCPATKDGDSILTLPKVYLVEK